MVDLPRHERWDLAGKRVLVRVDFNVPVTEVNGRLEVADDFRLRAALPLFENLIARGASVVAATHFGRPRGRVVEEFSVAPIRRRLEELAPAVELMENLRFSPGEEANDPAFGASLVEGVDYYINEAFGVSHRAHASIMVPPSLVPSAAGPNLAHEVETILSLLSSPVRPFVAIVGGAKVADKLGIVRVLAERADTVIVGGGMAYTFEAAQGRSIGSSLYNEQRLEECAALLATGKVLIPLDSRGLRDGEPVGPAGGEATPIDFGANIPAHHEGFDIGEASIALFEETIGRAATILWNGPVGFFEDPRFLAGTAAIAGAIPASSATSVVGGGDSVAALHQLGLADSVGFVSTGGGASLELVEFGDLPGLRALRESPFA